MIEEYTELREGDIKASDGGQPVCALAAGIVGGQLDNHLDGEYPGQVGRSSPVLDVAPFLVGPGIPGRPTLMSHADHRSATIELEISGRQAGVEGGASRRKRACALVGQERRAGVVLCRKVRASVLWSGSPSQGIAATVEVAEGIAVSDRQPGPCSG